MLTYYQCGKFAINQNHTQLLGDFCTSTEHLRGHAIGYGDHEKRQPDGALALKAAQG